MLKHVFNYICNLFFVRLDKAAKKKENDSDKIHKFGYYGSSGKYLK